MSVYTNSSVLKNLLTEGYSIKTYFPMLTYLYTSKENITN